MSFDQLSYVAVVTACMVGRAVHGKEANFMVNLHIPLPCAKQHLVAV